LQTGTTGPAMSAEAATPAISPAAQARKKRRSPASAYVSPGDVSPYFLPGMR
jgi:hypothetical protein